GGGRDPRADHRDGDARRARRGAEPPRDSTARRRGRERRSCGRGGHAGVTVTALRTLVRLIGLRHLREAPAQSVRAVAAVMVGVGAIIASRLVTGAIARGVTDSLEAFAGRTSLRLDADDAGIPESVLEAVRTVPGVEAAVPLLESPAYVVGSAGE